MQKTRDWREFKRHMDDVEFTVEAWFCDHPTARLSEAEMRDEFDLTPTELYYLKKRLTWSQTGGQPPTYGHGNIWNSPIDTNLSKVRRAKLSAVK